MSELSVVPGSPIQVDTEARLQCPACESTDVNLAGTTEIDGAAWVNHTVTCRSCGATSRLALAGAFGKVVVRWLTD